MVGRVWPALVVTLILALTATAAVAKEPMGVTISDGNGSVVELEEGEPLLERLRLALDRPAPVVDTDRIEALLSGSHEVGPRLELLWHLGDGHADPTIVVRQYLYPWAPGGPLLLVPPREPERTTRGAWFGVDASVIEVAEDLGLGWSRGDGPAPPLPWLAAGAALLATAALWNATRFGGVRNGEGDPSA